MVALSASSLDIYSKFETAIVWVHDIDGPIYISTPMTPDYIKCNNIIADKNVTYCFSLMTQSSQWCRDSTALVVAIANKG